MIGRREFITLFGGTAVAWPLAARAQQPAMPVIGFLSTGSAEDRVSRVLAFRKGLSELGYVEGRNVAIEYRWSENDDTRLMELARDLVRHGVAVIATLGGTAPVLAAKSVTTTIPIVFGMGGDPLRLGLVSSLNRPGGNVTGVNFMSGDLGTKRFGLLHEMLPQSGTFALLVNSKAADIESEIADAQTAALATGHKVEILVASTSAEIDAAFARLLQTHADALLVSADALFMNRRVQIVTLAARHAIPAIYPFRQYTQAGGLMSYGASVTEQAHQTGIYTGRILKGELPANLPVMRATMFEFVITCKQPRLSA
jgi:putative ABC transport system substrate-binding protein